MWILEFRGEGQTYTGPAYYCLLEGCEYIVGRKEKEADIVLHFEADISISRKHAKIVTAPGSSSASESAAIRIADISKHGTILSGQSPLQPSELRSITVNDVILFGRSQALFRVQYRDFLVCFDEDSIEPQALEKAKNQLQKLGVFVVPAPALIACSNSKQSTTSAGSGHVSLAMLYVTQEIRITTRFLHALLYGYVPVTVSYIDTLYEKLRSSTAESLKLVPSAGSFFPATGSAALKPIQRTGNLAQLTLYPMKPPMNERDARSESNAVPALLSGFSFVFPSQELMATWSVILREVGATVYTMVLNVDAPVVVDLGISVPHDDTKDSEEPNTFVFLPDSLFIQYTNDPSSLPGVLGVAMRYGCAAAPESALLHLIYSRTDVRSILYRGSRSVRMLSFAERTTLPVPSATHPAPAGHYSRKNRDTAKSPDSMPDEVRSNDGTPDVNTNSLRVTHDDPSQLPPLEDEFNMAISTGVLGSSQDTPHSTRLPTPISLSSVPSGIREHSAVQLHEPHYITPTKQTGVARSENNPNATSVNETTGANLNVRSPNPATGVVARSLKRNERGTSSMIVSPSNRATASLVPRRVSIGTTHIRATTPTGAPTVTGQTGTTSPGASVPQTAHAHLSSKLVAKVKAPSGGGLDSITTLCNDHERYLVRQCLTKLHEISERAEKRRYVTDVQLDFIRSVFQKNEKFLASLTQCIEQSEFDPTQPRHIDEITQMEASQSWNLCTSINRSIVTVIQKVNGDTSFADGSIALSPTTPTFVLHPTTPQTNSGGAYPKVGETPHSAGEGTHRANITPRANATPERSIMRSRSRTQQSNTSSLAQRNTPSKRPFSPASRVVGRTGTPRSSRMDGFSKTSSIRGASPVLSARGSFPRRSFTPVSISRSVQSGGTAQGATSVAERTKNVLFPSSPKAPRLGAVRTFEKEAGVSECGSMFNGTTSVPPVGYSCVRANTPNARSSAQRSISATGSGRRGTPQKSRLREIENLTISNISNANNIGAIRELRNVYLNEFGEIHGDELFLKWFLSRPQTWLKDLTRALARRGMVPDDILRAPMKKLLEPDEIPARL